MSYPQNETYLDVLLLRLRHEVHNLAKAALRHWVTHRLHVVEDEKDVGIARDALAELKEGTSKEYEYLCLLMSYPWGLPPEKNLYYAQPLTVKGSGYVNVSTGGFPLAVPISGTRLRTHTH